MDAQSLTAREARQRLEETRHRDAPFEEKAREALELGEQYLGADNAHLSQIDTESGGWEATVSTDPRDGPFPEGLELDLQRTYCRETIAADGPVTLHNAPAQGWDNDPAFEAQGIHCYHGTTLFLDGDPYGTLCFVADEPREEAFENDETLFAELVSRLLEREIERQHHQTELARRANVVNVLNRVLRHNMRNDMSVLRGHTQMMADQLEDSSSADTALEKIDDLIELSEKAREVEKLLDQNQDRTQQNMRTLIESVVADVSDEFPAVSVSVDADPEIRAEVLPTFERCLRELVENAAKHGGKSPSVTITVDHTPQAVEVRVADTGPGLSDNECEVLKAGVETPLVHGSGLGLWLVHWIVTDHNGTVEATVTDTGTTMMLSIPRVPASESTEDLADLRQAADQYQAAFEESFDAQLLLDNQARIIEINPAAERIFDLEQAEFRGLSLEEFYPQKFDFKEFWSSFLHDGRTRDINTLTPPNGKSRRVEYSAVTDVVPGQHLFIARDVTDRQERKADLERYETVLESVNDVAWVYDEQKQVTFSNQANPESISIPGNQLTDMSLSAFEHLFRDPETFDTWQTLVEDILAGDVESGELDVAFDRDNDPLIMNLRAAPVPDSDNPTGVAVIASDITERKQRERALTEYETIVESLGDAVYVLDENGTFTYANDELVELVGYDREAIIGNTPSLFKSTETVEQAEHRLGQLLSSDGPETVSFEVEIQPCDGDPILCEDKMGVLPYEGDEFSGSVGTLRDITKHKKVRTD